MERFGVFAAELSAAADLADVLTGVAEAFLPPRPGRGPSAAAVAYALDERDGSIFAVCRNGDGPGEWRSFAGSAGAGAEAIAEAVADAPRPAAEAFAPLLAEGDEWAPWPELEGLVHQGLWFAGRRLGGVLYDPAGPGGADVGAGAALAPAMAMALALVQQRCRAAALSEELAGASRRLADSQQALAEARTLEAVGDLAAGAAHELNNPLAVVSGRAQLMRDRAVGEEERKVWQTIVEQANRVSDIISDLMEFASPRRPRPAVVEPAALLRSAAEAFANSAHPQAGRSKVDIEVGEGTGELWADVEQIRSVLVELISNAAAAAADPHIRLKAQLEESGRNVLLTVRDNGPGMDAAVAMRVYTPFFSAHSAGRRRGLGLPKAKRHVEINGGRMRIVTRPGDGTTVFVQLPRRGP
jgi:signal transduction histidine kinase